jgi:hypothetical protein
MEKSKKEPQQQSQETLKEVSPDKKKTSATVNANLNNSFITPNQPKSGIPDSFVGRVFTVLD